jgi:hypothetical protein
MMQRFGCLLFLALFLVPACGSDDDDAQAARTRYITSCRNFCTAANGCSSSINVDECSVECQGRVESTGPNLSGVYLDHLDQCISEATCAELAANLYWNLCEARARSRTSPTATVTRFCDRVVDEDRRCSRLQRGTVCPDYMKVFSDEALTRAQTCLDRSCDLQEACVDQELGTSFAGG